MAQASLDTNATRAAAEWATKATTLDPDDDYGWRLLSAAASRNRDYGVAVEASTKARELAPEVWLNHAQRVQVDLNGSQFTVTDDTWDAAHEAMRLAPEEPGPFLIGASLAKRRGFTDGAETFAKEALRLDPESLEAKHLLASIRLDGNDMAGATVSFLALADESPGARRRAAGLRRAVLRTLEWVNGILLCSLLLIGLLAVGGAATSGSKPLDHAAIALALVLTLGGLALAWRRYRRGLGDTASDLFRRLPSVAPSLVVLATFQAVVLLATVVIVILVVLALGPLDGVLLVATLVAAAMTLVCLTYAAVLHAAL